MGKAGKAKASTSQPQEARKPAEDDDDAILSAAIAENRVFKEKAASEAAASAAAASAITAALDKLPVFAIADAGRPLQYTVGRRKLAVFYADVAAAKAQQKATERQVPGCDLIAVGLGGAYRLSYDGKAAIVPGVAELRAAGAPEGAQPMGQDLPLFACTKLGRYVDGGLVMPLFMSHADCAAAVEAAANADAPESDGPAQISALSLQSVVDQLGDPSSPAFSFVAPSSSVEHNERYVGKGVYMRRVEPEPEPEDVPPPLAAE